MLRLLVLLAVLWSVDVVAEAAPTPKKEQVLVYQTRDNLGMPAEARLFPDRPCTDKAVHKVLLKAGFSETSFAFLRAARLTWHAKEIQACWLEKDGVVHAWDTDGDVSTLYKKNFLPEDAQQPAPKQPRRLQGTERDT